MSTINSISILSSYLIPALISALTISIPPTSEFNIRPQLTISNRTRRSPNNHNIRTTLHIGPIISKHGTLILHQSSCPRDWNLHQQPIHWNAVECYKSFTAVSHPHDAYAGYTIKRSHRSCAMAAMATQSEVNFGGEFEVGTP